MEQLDKEYAIRVKDVSKMYKLYERNRDRFVDAFSLSKKKRYKEHFALNHLSFDIKKGETVGIIGTNGAGKSTILKIITGVLNPTLGEVVIDGRISALLELGAGFNPEYNGIENIYLNSTMMGFTKEEVDAKMDDILEFADIGEFVYQPVKTYSSGMFVRLAFAVAINIEPEILIVDEALSVGDVFFQAKCYQKFEDFKQEGKTILFVSHDLGSISKYCDRVVLLNKGQKLDEGTPKDMIDLYKKILAGPGRQQGTEISKSRSFSEIMESADGWKNYFQINPSLNEYGDGKAEIIDFAIVDEQQQITSTIIKGTSFQIKSKVHFFENVEKPIFTFTIKTVRGIDVTGTNTLIEQKEVDMAKAGETYVITFQQDMNLQGGEYLLSISCTGYEKGVLKAHHRLYDLISISVISDKNTVGFYDMNSVVSIDKVEE